MSHNQCKVWGHEVQCRTFSAYIIHKVQCNIACCKIHCTMHSVFSALRSRKEWWCCFSFSSPLTIRWHMLILHLAVQCLIWVGSVMKIRKYLLYHFLCEYSFVSFSYCIYMLIYHLAVLCFCCLGWGENDIGEGKMNNCVPFLILPIWTL